MFLSHRGLGRRPALVLGLASGLAARPGRAAPLRITDALGRAVALRGPAERIVIDFNYEEFTAVAGPAGWDRVVGFNRTQWAVNRAAVFRRYLQPIPRLAGLADVGSVEEGTWMAALVGAALGVSGAVMHDLNAAARFADQVALMRGGRLLASGPPADVLAPPLLRDAYAVEVAVLPGPDGFPVVVPLGAAEPWMPPPGPPRHPAPPPIARRHP